MILKQVTHHKDSNSVEATWVDDNDKVVKCHSYADVQMDMLRADLGLDSAQYESMISIVKANIKPVLPKTPEQLAQEASTARDEAMLLGVDYQGSIISLTDVDGNGMLQVKAAFEMGLTATTIHFKNGTKLPIVAADFPAFALWFVTERNRFFV